VEPFLKYVSDYPGAAPLELFFTALFYDREDYILESLTPAIEARKRMKNTPVTTYREAESTLNQVAARASLRRGLMTQAMDYAVASVKEIESKNFVALRVLLICMRGIEPTEIILVLNSQFDTENARKLSYLTAGTRMHGFMDIHTYYLDKLIKKSFATKADYLFLLILHGKYSEAAAAAADMYAENIARVVGESLLIAAICAGDAELFNKYREYFGEYEALAEGYFSNENFAVTELTLKQLRGLYTKIALAAGTQRADSLLKLFWSDFAVLCFHIKARFCVDNALYPECLEEEMPDPEDAACNRLVTESLLMLGCCDEALARLEDGIKKLS
jgi:hypothetical protein